MSYRYEFIEDVAVADAAFRVTADSWSELLVGAAMAATRVMVDPASLQETRTVDVTLEADSIDDLLFKWLSEIVYLKDAEQLLLTGVDLLLDESPSWRLRATLHGDTIDLAREGLGQDIKAVTYHLFKVWRDGSDYCAQVVLDI